MTLTSPAERELADLPAMPPRLSTAEHAAQVLRAQIAAGRLLPGTRLREAELSAAFAISRNTVREVFQLLGHERLVDHLPHRGVTVRRVGAADITEVYVARRLVEPLGVVAALAEEPVRARLRGAVEAQAVAVTADDWEAVGTADIDFHRSLVAGCASVHLSAMFETLLAELRLAFLLLPDRRGLHEPYVARNARLNALIDDGQRAAALAELDDYLHTSERHVLSWLRAGRAGD